MNLLILNQNRDELINLDNIEVIYMNKSNGKINYQAYGSESYRLGDYKDTPEHENQLERIAQCIGAASVYKMAEE